MPAPLKVDWSLAESLFQEGLALKNVAMRTGIPYGTLAKRALRHQWQQMIMPPKGSKTKVVQVAAPVCQQVVVTPDRASRWTNRVGTMAERCMSKLEDKLCPEDTDLDTVEQIVRIMDVTDRTARRTFGLDVQRSDQHVTLHVQSEVAQSRQLPDQSQIVDVETVQNQDTNQVQTDKSSETPTNPT